MLLANNFIIYQRRFSVRLRRLVFSRHFERVVKMKWKWIFTRDLRLYFHDDIVLAILRDQTTTKIVRNSFLKTFISNNRNNKNKRCCFSANMKQSRSEREKEMESFLFWYSWTFHSIILDSRLAHFHIFFK